MQTSTPPLVPVVAFTYVPTQHVLGFVTLKLSAEIVVPALREASPEDLVLSLPTNALAGQKLARMVYRVAPGIEIPPEEVVKMIGPWISQIEGVK